MVTWARSVRDSTDRSYFLPMPICELPLWNTDTGHQLRYWWILVRPFLGAGLTLTTDSRPHTTYLVFLITKYQDNILLIIFAGGMCQHPKFLTNYHVTQIASISCYSICAHRIPWLIDQSFRLKLADINRNLCKYISSIGSGRFLFQGYQATELWINLIDLVL